MAHGNVDATVSSGFLSQLHVELLYHFGVGISELRPARVPGVFDVAPELFEGETLGFVCAHFKQLIDHVVLSRDWMRGHVLVYDESAQVMVNLLVDVIPNDAQDIETGENRVC